jgi:hypothetical protein
VSRRGAALVLGGLAALAGPAAAEPDLRVRRWPAPRHLVMRAAAAVSPSPQARVARTAAAAPDPAAAAEPRAAATNLEARAARAAELGVAPTDAAAALRFRMDLGFAIDGAALRGNQTGSGNVLPAGAYTPTRGYGFGDLYVGSRGLIVPNLATYLAAHAVFEAAPGATTPPLASNYDRVDNLQIRSAWAESDSLFENRWLAPIRVRAGRQWIYGVAPIHFDGAIFGWEQRVLAAHIYAGSRVPDWDDRGGGRGPVTGVDAHLDLQRWRGFPMVLDGAAFSYADHQHAELTTSVTRGRGFALRGTVRSLDGRLAHERLTARLRVSEVTLVSAELDHRSSYDWRWDPEFVTPSADPGAAKRYLDLGQVGPRAVASLRAGTVLLDNIDLLIRGGGALDQKRSDVVDSSFAASWGELGAAFEVRARRTLALGGSALVRKYLRDAADPVVSRDSAVLAIDGAPLPASPTTGEQSFVEVGLSARYSGGARTLSASAELVARRVRWHRLYVLETLGPHGAADASNEFDGSELRGGGRFALNAWITPRVRLRAEYELSTTLERVPELLGYKNLRITLEGTL